MSELIEAVAGQQNQANDVPHPNADTAAQHIEEMFAMPEFPSTNEVTQNKLVEVDQRTKQKEPKVTDQARLENQRKSQKRNGKEKATWVFCQQRMMTTLTGNPS